MKLQHIDDSHKNTDFLCLKSKKPKKPEPLTWGRGFLIHYSPCLWFEYACELVSCSEQQWVTGDMGGFIDLDILK